VRIVDTLIALWFWRRPFTLREIWMVATGKAKLGFRED